MKTQSDSIRRLRIALKGDLGGHDALSLSGRLPLSDLAGAKYVMLSLEEVTRIDEAGLAMLVRLYSHLRVRGIRLQLVDVPVYVDELLERIGFSRLVSCARVGDRGVSHHTIALRVQVEAGCQARGTSRAV